MARIIYMVEMSWCVDCEHLRTLMTEPFVWYDFEVGEVIAPPTDFEREYKFLRNKIVSWCVRRFEGITIPWTSYRPLTYKACAQEVNRAQTDYRAQIYEPDLLDNAVQGAHPTITPR